MSRSPSKSVHGSLVRRRVDAPEQLADGRPSSQELPQAHAAGQLAPPQRAGGATISIVADVGTARGTQSYPIRITTNPRAITPSHGSPILTGTAYDQMRLKHALEEIDILKSLVSSQSDEIDNLNKKIESLNAVLKTEQGMLKSLAHELQMAKEGASVTATRLIKSQETVGQMKRRLNEMEASKKQAKRLATDNSALAAKLRQKLVDARESQKELATKHRNVERAILSLQDLMKDGHTHMEDMKKVLERSISEGKLQDTQLGSQNSTTSYMSELEELDLNHNISMNPNVSSNKFETI